mgnify:CR=1 FL=1
MKELLSLKVSGLFTYADKFSAVPEGSMSIANNIVIDQTNIFSPRRGFSALDTTNLVSNQLENIESLQYFNNQLTLFSSDTTVGTVHRYDIDNTLWNSYTLKGFGTDAKYVKPTDAASIRTTNGNKNVYLTTSEGIKKTFTTSEIGAAGVPIGFSPTLSLTGSPGVLLLPGASVGYRVVYGYKDDNKNLIFGAPSSAVIITNTTATDKNVTLSQTTPNTNIYPVDETWFVRIYRTEIAENSTEPGDEMYLVTEINFASTPVTLTYEDVQPDDLLTTPLYTNANQEGIQGANYDPPAANDIGLFNGYTLFGNITEKAKATLQLLSTGKSGSVTDALGTGDTVSFNDGITSYSVTGKYLFKFQADIDPTVAVSGGAPAAATVTDISSVLTAVMTTPYSTLTGRTVSSRYISAGGTYTSTGATSLTMSGVVWTLPTGTCRKTRSAESVTIDTPGVVPVADGTKFASGQVIRLNTSDYTIESIAGNDLTLTTAAPDAASYTLYYYDISAGWDVSTAPGASLILEDVNEDLFNDLKVQDKIKLTGDTTVYTIVELNTTDKTITLDTAITTTTGVNSLTAITVFPQNTDFTISESNTSANFLISVSVQAARDIEETAISIAAAVNALNKPITAFYSSTAETLPGQIDFYESVVNSTDYATTDISFRVTVDANTGFSTSGNTDAERVKLPNILAYSKFQQPEHVPLKNRLFIGSAATKIKRIIPLRTACLIFTDDGIYRLTGNTESSFQVTLLDNTAILLAENSLTVLNNAAIGLFDQGVCQVSETVNIISRPIEDILLRARNQTTDDQLNSLTFGIGYQSDRKYLLSLPTSVTEATEGTGSQILVFNILNQTWTSWDRKERAGCIGYGDKLFVTSEGKISEERKNFDDSDIADEQILLTITPTIYDSSTYASTAYDSATYYIVYNGIDTGITTNSRFTVDFTTSQHTVFAQSVVVDVGMNTTTITLDAPIYDTYPIVLSGACNIVTYPDYSEIAINTVDFANVRVGDILWTHNEKFSRIIAVNDVRSTVNVLTPVWFTDFEFVQAAVTGGDVAVPTILPYIDVVVEWNPITAGSPATLKHFSEATILTTSAIQQPTIGFRGATNPSITYVEFGSTTIGNWGMFPWGNNPWGGEPAVLRYRTFIPSDNQKDSMLIPRFEQKTSYNNFECSGLSISYRQLGSKVVR